MICRMEIGLNSINKTSNQYRYPRLKNRKKQFDREHKMERVRDQGVDREERQTSTNNQMAKTKMLIYWEFDFSECENNDEYILKLK